jgi:antiviral helicase SLH1
MSPSLDTAESQWLSQLAAMRAAIAELKLPKPDLDAVEYGTDLLLNEEVVDVTGRDNLWDIISDLSEDEYISEDADEIPVISPDSFDFHGRYDESWLAAKCMAISNKSSGLDAYALQTQIEEILASKSSGEDNCRVSDCNPWLLMLNR